MPVLRLLAQNVMLSMYLSLVNKVLCCVINEQVMSIFIPMKMYLSLNEFCSLWREVRRACALNAYMNLEHCKAYNSEGKVEVLYYNVLSFCAHFPHIGP